MSHKSEDEFMKNLSANEKRKLMRHIESAQSNVKKAHVPASQPSSRNYNISPKPFHNVASKATQPSKFSNTGSSSAQGKPSGLVSKPVRSSNERSSASDNVAIPSLNQELVKMFNAQDNASKVKSKNIIKKASVSDDNPPPISNFKKPPHVITKSSTPVNASFSTSNLAKVNPVPVASYSRPSSGKLVVAGAAKGPPAWKQALLEKKNSDKNLNNVHVSSSANQQIGNQFTSRNSSNYTKTPPPLENKKPSSNVKPVLKDIAAKPLVSSSSTTASSTKLAQSPVVSTKPAPVRQRIEPVYNKKAQKGTPVSQSSSSVDDKHSPALGQQRVEPLSDKISSKISPPTAVVPPFQEKPQEKASFAEPNNSSAEARLRSVSTPVQSSQSESAISYNSAVESVNLPDVSLANNNSVMANEPKMKRSFSEASKVAAHLKSSSSKNKKLGHDFQPHELKDWVNWCDACGSVILSLFGKCVSCTKCKMVCHGKCAMSVSLTCEADQQARSLTLTDSALNYYKTIVHETKDESSLKEYNTIQRVITIEEVQEKIDEFNRTVKGTQQMTLLEDGETFRGFIRVSMNLTRPVSVVDNTSKTVRKSSNHQRKASFYIDKMLIVTGSIFCKGAMKALHLTSETTAEQVVQALLLKYNITDNPMKFALFEKEAREEGHVILRKMLPRERPLFLRLLWGNGNSNKRGFTLQENESRDIHWESFSIAELHTFIKILDKEENDYILDIKRKYKNKAQDIRSAMDYLVKVSG